MWEWSYTKLALGCIEGMKQCYQMVFEGYYGDRSDVFAELCCSRRFKMRMKS